ncbi:hypothetical protein [Halomonas sp. TD01]|uniref:hypothetical protein n=1 Tax=Halomonas sp. TD01 TaxID=999141 RepID=UPI000214F135|nr:hypothetical protein [Halomonas sp. TD01]EGP21239.1 hypothetical protein GME_02310 [Halomonas sp. TD01]CAH1043891.1 hypothetical protein HPTD01_2369 [Halomonas sp. TD01]
MPVSLGHRQLTAGFSLLLLSGAVSASPQQFEADLRERLGNEASAFTVAQVYEQSETIIAEDIAITYANGDVFTIERYLVEGDYHRPDSVMIDGMAVSEADSPQPFFSIVSIELPNAAQAVPSIEEMSAPDFVWKAMNARDITLNLQGEAADEFFSELDSPPLEGHLHIETLTLEEASSSAIGLFDMQGVSADFNDLESGISVVFSLANLRVEQLTGVDTPGEESVEHAELSGVNLSGEGWSVVLDSAWVEGNSYVGDAGFEGAFFDIGGLLPLLPLEQRQEFETFNKLLTGGSGQLLAEGRSHSRWDEEGETDRLISDGYLRLSDAAGIEYSLDVPITLPKSVSIEQAMQNPALFESAMLHGGDVVVAYTDEGLLPRLTTEIAANESITEAQAISKALGQARELEPLLGSQITKLMTGLVDIMAGHSQALTVNVALPNPFTFNQFMMNPMGHTERFTFTFELK